MSLRSLLIRLSAVLAVASLASLPLDARANTCVGGVNADGCHWVMTVTQVYPDPPPFCQAGAPIVEITFARYCDDAYYGTAGPFVVCGSGTQMIPFTLNGTSYAGLTTIPWGNHLSNCSGWKVRGS